MKHEFSACPTADPSEQPVRPSQQDNSDTTEQGQPTIKIVFDKKWTMIFASFAGVMAVFGIALLIISIHIQTETGIRAIRRTGAVMLSLCAVSYFISMGVAIRDRRLTYIPMRTVALLTGTIMAQVLIFGIAKASSSKILGYNVSIGILTGVAIMVDIALLVIQYFWGTESI